LLTSGILTETPFLVITVHLFKVSLQSSRGYLDTPLHFLLEVKRCLLWLYFSGRLSHPYVLPTSQDHTHSSRPVHTGWNSALCWRASTRPRHCI